MGSEPSSERPQQRPNWSKRLLGKLARVSGGETITNPAEYDDYPIPYRERGVPAYDAHILRGPKGMVWSDQLIPRSYFDLTVVTERSPHSSKEDYIKHVFIPYLDDMSEPTLRALEPVHVIYYPALRGKDDAVYYMESTFGREFGRDTVDFARPIGLDRNQLVRVAQLRERTSDTMPEPENDSQMAIDTAALQTMTHAQKNEAHELALLVELYHRNAVINSTDPLDS